MVGAGTPNHHHQRALDMLNGRSDPDGEDEPLDNPFDSDDERIRVPPAAAADPPRAYDDYDYVDYDAYERERRETAQSELSMYSKDDARATYAGYPESVIDMPAPPPQAAVYPLRIGETNRDSNPFEPHPRPGHDSDPLGPGFWANRPAKDTRRGCPRVGWTQSLIAIMRSSYLNPLLAFVPVAWGVHLAGTLTVPHTIQFALCAVALIPLCKLLAFGGANLALYCGRKVGDLVMVTSNNAPEALLCMFLLVHCQLKLLQSTIVGLILLRLLFVPACTAAFIAGIRTRDFRPRMRLAESNSALLMTGILAIVLPATFFAALNSNNATVTGATENAVSDDTRGSILQASRGLAVILLAVYIFSRIFPSYGAEERESRGEDNALPGEVSEVKETKMREEEEEDPEVNPYACLILLFLAVGMTAVTLQFLVDSIEAMEEQHSSKTEWFGLILLPFISFSPECIVMVVSLIKHHLEIGTPVHLPKNKTDLSTSSAIQLLLLWTPLLVLLAWATHKPLSLLFDLFEVVVLVSAMFLANNVTADARMHWSDGATMLGLYFMISLTAWFYPGQPAIATMTACQSVQSSLAAEGVPPGSTFTNVSFAGFHASIDNNQINNFTEHLQNLKKLYDVLMLVEQQQ